MLVSEKVPMLQLFNPPKLKLHPSNSSQSNTNHYCSSHINTSFLNIIYNSRSSAQSLSNNNLFWDMMVITYITNAFPEKVRTEFINWPTMVKRQKTLCFDFSANASTNTNQHKNVHRVSEQKRLWWTLIYPISFLIITVIHTHFGYALKIYQLINWNVLQHPNLWP